LTHLNLPDSKRYVDVHGVKLRAVSIIEGVIHKRKWVGALTHNLVKNTVVNA
jgi:hypothetical protein